jgi:cell division septum initiation protein DivIVA
MKKHTIRQAAERCSFFITVLLTTLTLAACASAPLPPTESLNMASDAIANAEQAQARRYAGAELEEANRYLENANKAVEAEKMSEADRLAKQARIAAELAMARTEVAKAAAINREMGRSAKALDEELQRQGDQQ